MGTKNQEDLQNEADDAYDQIYKRGKYAPKVTYTIAPTVGGNSPEEVAQNYRDIKTDQDRRRVLGKKRDKELGKTERAHDFFFGNIEKEFQPEALSRKEQERKSFLNKKRARESTTTGFKGRQTKQDSILSSGGFGSDDPNNKKSLLSGL